MSCDTDASVKLEPEAPVANKRQLEFTSENHKLEIMNLPGNPKFHTVKEILERQLKLKAHKIRVGNRRAFVTFASEQERDEAMAKINGHEWRGRTLSARVSQPRQDPFVTNNKKARHGAADSAEIADEAAAGELDVNAQVCPLYKKPYEEQLKFKEASMRSVLNIGKELAKLCPSLKSDAPSLHEWVESKRDQSLLEGIEPSPCIQGYRNKCEFNVGLDGTLGFRMGAYKAGSRTVVHPPPDCPIINALTFKVLAVFEAYLKEGAQEKTLLRPYNQVTHEGHLRMLTVRTNQRDECLMIVDLHPQQLTQQQVDQEIKSIVELYKDESRVVSVYFNVSEKNHMTDASETLRLVHGQKHLFEYLSVDPEAPLKFRIGPSSFFQVNTKAAELLYRSVIELAGLDSNSLVLDVGCGTGTIGLSLARRVHFVLGVELVAAAVEDAKANAAENGISNVAFFAGKAEELIGELISILKSKWRDNNERGQLVAIIDPPRVGFNQSFVKTIRASNIRKLIYIACDPQANSNLVSLCRPTSKAYQGEPFVPTRAKAFDLFPHTKFCELVVVYERLGASPDSVSQDEPGQSNSLADHTG